MRLKKNPTQEGFQERKVVPLEDAFSVQLKENKTLLGKLQTMPYSEKIPFLETIQVENANICPSIAYNPEDEICLRCEWIANCALRKEKEK